MVDSVRLPDDSKRLAIIGRTGTGKTVVGAYHLSQRNFNNIPWIMVNFKRDELLDSIPHVKELDGYEIPKANGLYQIHPHPDDFEKRGGVGDQWLMRIWERGGCGIYFDEAMLLDMNLRGIKAIQTQGRSLQIPTIACTQRPVAIQRTFFSEADFFQIFPLNDKRDYETIDGFIPHKLHGVEFPDRYSYYHDVGKGKKGAIMLPPVPSPEETLNVFDMKLAKYKKVRKI